MRFESDLKLDFDDVLIRPKRSTIESRKDVSLERSFKFLHSDKEWSGFPFMAANMDSSGTFEMAWKLSEYKMVTCLHKFYSLDEYEEFFKEFDRPDYVAYSLGIKDEDFEKLKALLDKGLGDKFSFVVLDVPNGYLDRFIKKVKELRELCSNHIIVAGNVVTNEMTEQLLIEGADIVKVGIGSGAACTTRLKTGVGYPQLSSIVECADAAHGISFEPGRYGLVISDGGITHPSCAAKAFCGGADFVMAGSVFAGYDQSGGRVVERDGKKYKEHYGSSSFKAQKRHYNEVKDYRASEGRSTLVPYKGDIDFFIKDIMGSIRSTATYIGARRIKEFPKRATFLQVTRQLNRSFEKYED